MNTAPPPTHLHPQFVRYLEHVRFEKRLAERTCELYRQDLIKYRHCATRRPSIHYRYKPIICAPGWRA